MKVEFVFDKAKVEAIGHTLRDVHYTIKQQFAKHGIPCVAEEESLVFEDCGRKDDFSNMWLVIMPLTRSQWFLETASSCFWYPNGSKREDVLIKAKRNFARHV